MRALAMPIGLAIGGVPDLPGPRFREVPIMGAGGIPAPVNSGMGAFGAAGAS